ncbi:MAG: glycoside hydrolase family 88 protein [Deltaproteobacteria bacterium]|nr:glycoside hydrolase family 88 protein [Deltaproteobacteria bacterium]
MPSFDIISAFSDKAWLEDMAQKLDRKMRYAVEKAREVDFMPYSTEGGQWKKTAIGWWTNGFWPANMWQMYRMMDDPLYREEALRVEIMLDEALKDFKNLSHDVGFMWLIHSGVRFALEKNPDSFDRTLYAAHMLAARFNPNGFIRAWNGEGREGWAIVDCMMNLPLLYWASEETGDPRFRLIAMRHADTTMEHFVRPDGSCNHIVIFDPETGAFLDNPGGQGYVSGSSWSRGQSWALYGFVLSYLHTGKQAYLDTAKRVANYFISQITDDWMPRCDFRQPTEPAVKDNAAGNIAACGLLELARAMPALEGRFYFDAAVRILKAQEKDAANWELNDPAIFTKCTSAWHDVPGRHITMTYGDYYFIEAVNKLRGDDLLFWYPNR